MSWFSEMAGKAESFLNKMDAVTAAAISKSTNEGDSINPDSMQPSLVTHQPKYSPNAIGAQGINPTSHSRTSSLSSSFSTVSSSMVHDTSGSHGNSGSHGSNLYGVNYSSVPTPTDDKLFEYLNSPQTGVPTLSYVTRRMSEDESSIGMVSNVSDAETASGKATPISIRRPSSELAQSSPIPKESKRDRIHSEEMQSLAGEISRVNKRVIELEQANKRSAKRAENWKQQVSASALALKQAQETETLLKNSIAEKDAKISNLESNLQILTRQNAENLNKIDFLEKERQILVNEKEASVEDQIRSSDNFQEVISKLNEQISFERDAKNSIQSTLMSRINELEENQSQLISDIASQTNQSKIDAKDKKELSKKLKNLEGSFQELQKEFELFKEKATKTLIAKDELIRNLQARSEMGDEGIADTDSTDTDAITNKTLIMQAEIDTLREQDSELKDKFDSAQTELDRIKSEMEQILEKYNQTNERLSLICEELINEQRNREGLLQDYVSLQEEFKYAKEESKKLRDALGQRLSDKEIEIDKLRKQLTSKQSQNLLQSAPPTGNNSGYGQHSVGYGMSDSVSSDSYGNFSGGATFNENSESRIKSLTESLIAKQAMVEQLSAQKNSLSLQLERCESRLRSFEDSTHSSPSGSVTIGMFHSSSASNLVNRYRPLMEESVQDGQVTRGVKRAYGQVDYFSIRLGQFLRMSPGARIAVLVYIIILHLWVFFLLFTYQPEIHNDL